MSIFPLDFFVIRTPGSERSIPLIQLLEADLRVRLHVIEATMISNQIDLTTFNIDVEQDYFWALTGRKLSYPEIGCAKSHNDARALASKSSRGAVILEDDARIVNLDQLLVSVESFLLHQGRESSLLSLTFDGGNKRSTNEHRISRSRLFGCSPLAVGYAITSVAARNLVQANSPIRYVADWPESNVTHYCNSQPLVAHGDGSTQSTIDPEGLLQRSKRNLTFTFSKLTFIDYLFRARKFVSFSDYLVHNYLRPIKHHLDTSRFQLIRIVSSKP